MGHVFSYPVVKEIRSPAVAAPKAPAPSTPVPRPGWGRS